MFSLVNVNSGELWPNSFGLGSWSTVTTLAAVWRRALAAGTDVHTIARMESERLRREAEETAGFNMTEGEERDSEETVKWLGWAPVSYESGALADWWSRTITHTHCRVASHHLRAYADAHPAVQIILTGWVLPGAAGFNDAVREFLRDL